MLEQKLHGKCDPILHGSRSQARNAPLGRGNRRECAIATDPPRRIIIGIMPNNLESLEVIADLNQFGGKPEIAKLFASILGVTVVQSPIGLSPRLVWTTRPSPYQPVRTFLRERVEEGVVGRTDRTLEVGLPRFAGASLGEAACRSKKFLAHGPRRGSGAGSGTTCEI